MLWALEEPKTRGVHSPALEPLLGRRLGGALQHPHRSEGSQTSLGGGALMSDARIPLSRADVSSFDPGVQKLLGNLDLCRLLAASGPT